MKLATIIGARPQFIKAAVVSRAINKWNIEQPDYKLDEVIIHTGQHYDANMSEVFFSEMKIPKPKYNLHIGGGLHWAMTGQMLEKIEQVLLEEKPAVVMVYGDTDSTLAGALAASKLHIPVAHVEAGLRSFNMNMPEEINRILTDRISSWLFCPTQTAMENLLSEGSAATGQRINSGDVMYDAVLFYKKLANPTEWVKSLVEKYKKFYLATIHRAENTDNPKRLLEIMMALEEISANIPVILPLHPRTKKILEHMDVYMENIIVMDPVGYFDMITLLEHCTAVFTDSGGMQKESYFFQKPCVTLRDETEWIELVEHNFNVLTGADKTLILQAEQALAIRNCDFYQQLYGDGNAGEKIIKSLVEGLF